MHLHMNLFVYLGVRMILQNHLGTESCCFAHPTRTKWLKKPWLSWFVHLELHSTRAHGMIRCGTGKRGGEPSPFSFLGLVKTCYSQLQKKKHLSFPKSKNTQPYRHLETPHSVRINFSLLVWWYLYISSLTFSKRTTVNGADL